jgi:hypothetical protein
MPAKRMGSQAAIALQANSLVSRYLGMRIDWIGTAI